MKILLAAATAAEIAPALAHFGVAAPFPQDLQFETGNHSVVVCVTGGGMIPSTFALTKALAGNRYDLIIQAGIGGSFNQDIPLGSVVVVKSEQLGDTGAEDHEHFLDVFDLGFADRHAFPFQDGKLVNPLNAIPFVLPEQQVAGITVSTVSGHAPTIQQRNERYQPTVESMEGAAMHYVGLQYGIPFVQVRAISNYVTPRDRDAWQIGKAVKALNDLLISWLGAHYL